MIILYHDKNLSKTQSVLSRVLGTANGLIVRVEIERDKDERFL